MEHSVRLDGEVTLNIALLAHSTGQSFGAVVHDLLRRGLGLKDLPAPTLRTCPDLGGLLDRLELLEVMDPLTL